MKVRELLALLAPCDPEARVFATLKKQTDFYDAADFVAVAVVEQGMYEPDLSCPPFVGIGDMFPPEEGDPTQPAVCLWTD